MGDAICAPHPPRFRTCIASNALCQHALETLAASQNYNRNGSAVEPHGVFGDVRRSGSSSAVNDYPNQRSGRAVYAKQRVGLQFGDARPNLSDWKPRVSDAPLHLDDKPARLLRILQPDVVGLGFAYPKRGAAVAVNACIPGFRQDKRNALFGTAVHETGAAIVAVKVAELVKQCSSSVALSRARFTRSGRRSHG